MLFDTRKAVQAAAVLLKHVPGQQMPYLQLLKLLYIADRESFRETKRPVLGGRRVAMKKGPLHSEVYDLIKGQGENPALWFQYLRLDEYDIELAHDPGDSELSDYEVDLLSRTAKGYGALTNWQLVELTHAFPEWEKNYRDHEANTSRTIHISDILDAVGLQDEKIAILAEIHSELQENRAFRHLLAGTCE